MNGLDLNLLTQFGVAGLMFGGFMFLLKWVLKLKEKILDDTRAERDRFLSIIQSYQGSVDKLAEGFNKQLDMQNAYVDKAQSDHAKIIEAATESCRALMEFRKENAERGDAFRREHEKMISHLEESYKVLLRINGEKHN